MRMTMTMTQDDTAHDENGSRPAAPNPFISPPNNPPIELPTLSVILPPIGETRSPAPTPPAVHAAIGFLCLLIQPNAPDVFETFFPLTTAPAISSPALTVVTPTPFRAPPVSLVVALPKLRMAPDIICYIVLVLYNVLFRPGSGGTYSKAKKYNQTCPDTTSRNRVI